MNKFCFLLSMLGAAVVSFGQAYNPLISPNTYQNADNPNYWKNKPPFENYWQQDIHYTISATIDEQKDLISGKEKLVYQNNSPDTLRYAYFHLYQNAFQPGSYYDQLQKANGVKPVYGPYEEQGLGTAISKFEVNGQIVKIEIDNTLLRVELSPPLPPEERVTFEIEFTTYFDNRGNVGRRMKRFNAFGYSHYDGVHWYPRIAVYDRKFGWTTDQHLGKEFYGDFGTFDVSLNFAEHFVVGATGNLVNRNEVLPAGLRQKLDIKNFADKPFNSPPSVIIPYDSSKHKTWIYHAENVHDFAFTADPTYRIGEAQWNGITCYALAQEPHASCWQNAASYAADVIRVFSEDFGQYAYHKMIVADARDGMEYPMLTLDGGCDPGYRGLLAHEIGHNWFYGQVGNNETYRAALDEGFTQFLTAWAYEKINGDTMVTIPAESWYEKKFSRSQLVRHARVYRPYINDAIKRRDPPLNTHSDDFGSALHHGGGYRHVYYKTATMLYNLQYVLGDELFLQAMQAYFNTWKIAHPYFEDFRNSIIQSTHTDLNWFFDQWLTTTKRIDYAVGRLKKENEGVALTFKRKGEMQMPLDFRVVTDKDSSYDFHLPNTWFVKETNATVLPKWTGWGKLNPDYTILLDVPGKITNVVIDPSGRLGDVYQLNNQKRLPLQWSFDSRINNPPQIGQYEAFIRPDLWYNGYDGFKVGANVNGNYLKYKHIFDFSFWVNTGVAQNLESNRINDFYETVSYRFSYRTGIEKISKATYLNLFAQSLDGLKKYQIGVEKWLDNELTQFYSQVQMLFRKDSNDLNYLLFPEQWIAGLRNNTLNTGIFHQYFYPKGKGTIRLNLRSSTLASDYQYAQLSLEAINKNALGKLQLNTRAFLQYGSGASIPFESALYLYGANPEMLMESKYNRSAGFYGHDWLGFGPETNHFHAGGGLNLRGYSGYLAPFLNSNDSIVLTYRGNTGASCNVELEFQDLFRWRPRGLRELLGFKSYLFGDVGVIDFQNLNDNAALQFADIRADFGIGTALTVKKFGPLEKVKPLTIRVDFPLFLNTPPALDPDYFDFRWVIGINRAF